MGSILGNRSKAKSGPSVLTSLDLPEWGGQRISMLREEDAWVDEKGRTTSPDRRRICGSSTGR
jgi:hypothetical protein